MITAQLNKLKLLIWAHCVPDFMFCIGFFLHRPYSSLPTIEYWVDCSRVIGLGWSKLFSSCGCSLVLPAPRLLRFSDTVSSSVCVTDVLQIEKGKFTQSSYYFWLEPFNVIEVFILLYMFDAGCLLPLFVSIFVSPSFGSIRLSNSFVFT